MERLRQDLEERLGDWAAPLPPCAHHPSIAAVAVCPNCRRPICGACLHPLPTSLRCTACRPWLERMVPAAWVAPLIFLSGMLGRRWALQTLAFCTGLALLIWLCPNLVRPTPPDLPDWLVGSRLDAPFLQQSYRLSSVGRAFTKAGKPDQATTYYARAEAACRRHIHEAGDSPLNPQIWMGIGHLLEKQRRLVEATNIYLRVLENDSPMRGVAAYHLGRIAETHDRDTERARGYYQVALEAAEQPVDTLVKLIEFYAEDRETHQWPYVVASLTGTVTGPAALRHEIAAALARCSGHDPPPNEEPTSVEYLEAE